ncbi:hypothetical protein L7F22_050606 [Adiantum nelumboides]|nr:hypothetical protein [Adiantum nelumboides]
MKMHIFEVAIGFCVHARIPDKWPECERCQGWQSSGTRKGRLRFLTYLPFRKLTCLQGMQSEEKRDALSSPASQLNPSPFSCPLTDSSSDKQQLPRNKPRKKKKKPSASPHWGCFHTFYWLLGFVCFSWWVVLVLYRSLPSLSEALSGPLPESPGDALRKQGLHAHHPVVFVPGTVTGGLELWEGHPCTHGMFRKRLWGGTFGEAYKRSFFELFCLCLHHVESYTHAE